MSTGEINLGEFNISSVDRIRVTIEKDEVAWAGIDSVVLVFEDPNRSTQFTRDMILESDANGIWYYDTTITDITTTGWWTLNVRVVDGSIIKRYPYPINFHVNDLP